MNYEPQRRTPRARSGAPGWRAIAPLAGLAIVLAVLGAASLRGDDSRSFLSPEEQPHTDGTSDADSPPFDPSRRERFELRAATRLSKVVFEKSPGGVLATAERTARFRNRVEAAAERSGTGPDTLEAMVFLESAGRPQVVAGPDPEAAAGLLQILAETGRNLLGMRIDLAESRRLTRRIASAERRDETARAGRLHRRRANIDERFDPAKALAAASRYLEIARKRLGREDLAVTSYHMGIGNLEGVIRAYVAPGDATGDVRSLVEQEDLSYAQIYFDSSHTRNARSHGLLSRLGDDSSNYYWKILASQEIMRLYREDLDELRRLARLSTNSAS